MYRTSLFLAFLSLLTSGFLVVAQDTNSTISPKVNSSESAGNMSVAETPAATVSSAALPPSSSSPSSPSSPTPSSSTTAAPTSDEGMLSSSSVSSASTTVVGSNSQEPTMAAAAAKPPRVWNDVTYIPMVAAIVSGFGLLILLMILFFSMALVYRYLGKEDSTMMLKKPKKGTDAFYGGQEPQSAQYLVSSMSITSFGSSPSDARLDSHLPNSPGVHYNRGFDVDHNPSGAGANGNGNGHEEGFKPIQIVAADVNPRPNSTHI